jgi:hypothetical protein
MDGWFDGWPPTYKPIQDICTSYILSRLKRSETINHIFWEASFCCSVAYNTIHPARLVASAEESCCGEEVAIERLRGGRRGS